MPDRNANIVLSLKDQATAGVKTTTQAFIGLTAEEQKAEQATLRMAQAYARLDAAQGNPTAGANRLRTALADATVVTQQHGVAIQTQIASLDAQAARLASGSSLAQQFGASFKSSLLGIVGPAAVATAAIGGVKAGVDSFVEAFKFKAELDQNTASITAQLRGVRDSGQAFKEAQVFADKYKLTQQDTIIAIQASVPLLRQSKSSLTDVLTVLAQLQVLKPEQGIQGAAFALAELQGGQTRSLATRFNIPIAKANELKKEIQDGGDAVQVLGKYLNDAGIGAEALETRTKGAAGAMNDLARAEERRRLAQAELAQGPGVNIIEAQTVATNDLTRSLGGGGTGNILKNNTALVEANSAALLTLQATLFTTGNLERALANAAAVREATYNDLTGVTRQLTDIEDIRASQIRTTTEATVVNVNALSEEAKKKIESSIASAQLAQEQAQLEKDSALAAQGLLGAGDQALILAQKYGIAADQAQFLIQQQQRISNATALADQRQGERDPNSTLTAAQATKFAGLRRAREQEDAAEAKRIADKAAQDAARLADVQFDNQLKKAKDNSAKIALLRQREAQTADPIERARIEGQIIDLQNQKVGGLNKELNLRESIYDSTNKQIDAEINLRQLRAQGVLDTLKEEKELRTARAILASSNASAEFKQIAQAKIDLIGANRDERAQKERELAATAGGTISASGKLLQSVPGGAPPIAVPGAPAIPGGSGAAPAAGSAIVLRLTDSAGRIIAESVGPFVMDDLLRGVRNVGMQRGA